MKTASAEQDAPPFSQAPFSTITWHPRPQYTPETITKLPYAIDESGRTLAWDLAQSPNLLITGATGTGRTVGISGLAMEICHRGFAARIIDLTGVTYTGLRDHPNVEFVATTELEAALVVRDTWQEMNRRHSSIDEARRLMSNAGTRSLSTSFDPIFLIIDEFPLVRTKLRLWYESAEATTPGPIPQRPPAWLFDLAAKARSANIHLLIGSPRITSDTEGLLAAQMRDSFGHRISCGHLDAEDAQMMWPEDPGPASVPTAIRGRCVAPAADGSGRPSHAQLFFTPDPRRARQRGSDQQRSVLEALLPATTSHPALHVVPAEGSGHPGADVSGWEALAHLQLEQVPHRPS